MTGDVHANVSGVCVCVGLPHRGYDFAKQKWYDTWKLSWEKYSRIHLCTFWFEFLVIILLLTQTAILDGPPRHFEHFHKARYPDWHNRILSWHFFFEPQEIFWGTYKHGKLPRWSIQSRFQYSPENLCSTTQLHLFGRWNIFWVLKITTKFSVDWTNALRTSFYKKYWS